MTLEIDKWYLVETKSPPDLCCALADTSETLRKPVDHGEPRQQVDPQHLHRHDHRRGRRHAAAQLRHHQLLHRREAPGVCRRLHGPTPRPLAAAAAPAADNQSG